MNLLGYKKLLFKTNYIFIHIHFYIFIMYMYILNKWLLRILIFYLLFFSTCFKICFLLFSGMEYFKHVLLVSSMQDKYVPYHSTRVEICRSATKDNSQAGKFINMNYSQTTHTLLVVYIKWLTVSTTFDFCELQGCSFYCHTILR